eukprot:g74399.t1
MKERDEEEYDRDEEAAEEENDSFYFLAALFYFIDRTFTGLTSAGAKTRRAGATSGAVPQDIPRLGRVLREMTLCSIFWGP